MKINKSPGPGQTGILRGHCYDGTGLFECDFWKHKPVFGDTAVSKCTLFGGPEGVHKNASEALVICDKIYGTSYEGDV